jgi:hypothetical protein
MPIGSDFDPASPTGLVLSYLTKQGLAPTSPNVRAALEQQARGGHALDSAQGSLTTEEPPAADQRNPSKTSKSVADKIEGNPPPADLSKVPNAEEYPGFAPTGTDTKTTSAQPGGDFTTSPLGDLIIAGAPALGMGAGAAYYLSRGGPTPGGNVAPPPEVAPQVTGDQYRLLPGPQTPEISPMDMAMQRALQPSGGDPRLGAPQQQPLALPPPASQAMPPGEGNIPIAPQQPGQPRVTTEELPNYRTRPRMRLRVPG